MVDAERKGQALVSEADKKLRTVSGVFGSLFRGNDKTDEAAELYCKAANSFKVAKNWNSAGNAFLRAAALESKSGERHITASHYVDAANCFRKVKTDDAVKYYLKAIDIYVDMGRFNMAARHHITVAELYESIDKTNVSKAIDHYQQAADYYQGEESKSSANKCLQKVAYYSAQQMQYTRAAELYENLGTSCMNTSILRYSVKDHFFHATLCHMCTGVHDGARALDKYANMFPAFDSSREYVLLKKLIGACEEQSVESFTEAVREFESITRFDVWHNTLLKTIKDSIEDLEYNLR